MSFTNGEARMSTPHLYISTLSTYDPQSHVSRLWKPRFPNIPKVSRAFSSAVMMPVNRIAISPGGDRIVSSGGSVCVWDAASGGLVKHLRGPQSWIRSVAFSPGGDRIVSGGSDSPVCVWDAASGKLITRPEFTEDSSLLNFVSVVPT
jgi:WD40 repeat protein